MIDELGPINDKKNFYLGQYTKTIQKIQIGKESQQNQQQTNDIEIDMLDNNWHRIKLSKLPY